MLCTHKYLKCGTISMFEHALALLPAGMQVFHVRFHTRAEDADRWGVR